MATKRRLVQPLLVVMLLFSACAAPAGAQERPPADTGLMELDEGKLDLAKRNLREIESLLSQNSTPKVEDAKKRLAGLTDN